MNRVATAALALIVGVGTGYLIFAPPAPPPPPPVKDLKASIKLGDKTGNCNRARTKPRLLDPDVDEGYAGIEWTIVDPANTCLGNTKTVRIKFINGAPPGCATAESLPGARTFRCDLGNVAPNTRYRYKVYIVTNGQESEVEDPDLEIVDF